MESFAHAYAKFVSLAEAQLQKRKAALAALRAEGVTPDLYTGSPCLFCLQSFGKIPWTGSGIGQDLQDLQDSFMKWPILEMLKIL